MLVSWQRLLSTNVNETEKNKQKSHSIRVFDFEPGNLLITHYIFDLLFMSIFKLHAIFVLVIFMMFSEHISAQPTYLTPSSVVNLQLKNWKSIRDEGIVKQNLDFSCGAAGLATILNQFYGQSISEQELLTVLDKGDFSDNCSYGNAGYVCPSHFVPLATPGIVTQGLKWMWNSKSPFYVEPRLNAALISSFVVQS